MVLTRQQKKRKSIDLISATRTSNYVKNDPILDYFDLVDANGYYVSENLSIVRKRSRSIDYSEDSQSDSQSDSQPRKKKKTSFDYIVEAGYLFEYYIIDKIKQMMKNNKQSKELIEINEKDIYLNAMKTIQVIKRNHHSLILGSVVINSANNTWGKPDIIVKGCWLKKYIKENIVGINIDKWYIIDIKSSTIQLINGGEDISSKLLYSVYKSQVYIYTQALNQSLKDYGISNDVEVGFILGKKYKYVQNKIQITKNSFDSLGVIDFEKEKNKGEDWNNKINSAINWLEDLKNNWKDFTLNPINRDELYPNMKNVYNKNWYGIKKNVALINKEITSLWYCGISNREKAWKMGIKSYMDPRLTPEILGFDKFTTKYNITDLMLKLLHNDTENYILNKKNNFMDWQNKVKWEFFVDFETYNYDKMVWDEANECNNIYNGNQKIYMCGISWIDTNTLQLAHKSFVIKYSNSQNLKEEFDKFAKFDDEIEIGCGEKIQVKWDDYIECVDEQDLMKKIVDFVNGFKPSSMTKTEYFKQTRLIHWSGAEPILFNKKIIEYQLDYEEYKLNWYDLLKVFKHPQYPIIIKECFGFGLKSVVKRLNELSKIDIVWPELDDGLLSSFIARDIYLSKCEESDKQMYGIVKYNWIDCKAMWVIIEWMRNCVSEK